MKTALIYSNDYLRHETGNFHPESKDRLSKIMDLLKEKSVTSHPDISILTPRAATEEELAQVHDLSYIKLVKKASSTGEFLDGDTPTCPESYEIAKLAAGGAIVAGDAVVLGEAKNAFAIIRPPGHHAEPERGMGFCIFNNIAVLIEHLRAQYNLKKFLVLDWDVHFGNGTAYTYYSDPTVLYISIHQDPRTLYPGTGFAHEIGSGKGVGYTVNIPLPPGSGDFSYLLALNELFVPLAKEFKPEIILVSAGQDAHFADPIANLQVTTNGFAQIAKIAADVANNVCNGKIVACLEGGYNLEALAYSTLAIISQFAGIEVKLDEPEQPPEESSSIKNNVKGIIEDVEKLLSNYWECFGR
ncbi:MAG: histone deacetylase [Euryarchaeota archaeon]|nr:histone deacetylase [Euryarchaeota archaeon]